MFIARCGKNLNFDILSTFFFLAKSYLLMTQMLPARYGSYLYDVSIYIWIWMWKDVERKRKLKFFPFYSCGWDLLSFWMYVDQTFHLALIKSQLSLRNLTCSCRQSRQVHFASTLKHFSWLFISLSLAIKVMTKDKYLLFVSSSFLSSGICCANYPRCFYLPNAAHR